MPAPTVAVERPVLTSAPRRFVLYRHRSVPHSELGQTIGVTFGELYACVKASGANPGGPPFVIYQSGAQPGVRRWEIDICAPVAAYAQIEAYIAEHGLAQAGPPREFYYSEPDVPPAETRTLIEWPVNQP